MRRFYIVPVIGNGFTQATARVCKYFHTDYPPGYAPLRGLRTIYYGLLPFCLIDAPNIDQLTHDEIAAHPDVIAFPENTDQQVGANLNTVQNLLEAALVPAHYVTATWTYAQILTRLEKLFLFAGRFQPLFAHRVTFEVWDNDITLSALPAFLLDDLQAAAQSLNIDSTSITGSTTVRDAMALLAQRYEP